MTIQKNESGAKIGKEDISINFSDFNYNLIDLEVVKKIVKPPIRLKIFLALYIYPELYVSQLSRLLKINKNTASRHLKKMKKDGILKTRIQEEENTIDKKFYSLTNKYLFEIEEYRKLLDFNNPLLKVFNKIGIAQNDAQKEIKQYAFDKFYNLVRALVLLILKKFQLFKDQLDSIEDKLGDLEYAEKVFGTYFQSPRKIDFYPIFLPENQLDEANKIMDECAEKLIALKKRNKSDNEENSILFLQSLIPIKDMLEKF